MNSISKGIRILKRYTISRPFRNLLADCLPGLGNNSAYWNFVGYLLFGCQFDENNGKLMLWKETLAEVTGADCNNFPAIRFLKDFQRDVMSPAAFDWSTYNPFRSKCRHLTVCIWPEPVQAALPDEQANRWRNQGRVYFDGTAFTKATLAQERTEERRAAEARPGLCPDAQMIQQYLNSRAPHLFTQTVTKNIENARAVVVTLELGKTPKAQEDTREAQRRILRRIEDQPQPFYGASRDGNTVRLIAPESLQSLQKDVRLALVPDWAVADLRCSQLAICGTLWDVPPVLDFLKTGQSIWEHLGGVVGIPDHLRAKTKKHLKDALYATCFGMDKPDIQRAVTRDLKPYGIKNAGARFVGDSLIVALLEARTKAIEEITAAGGAKDCYGRKLSTQGGRLARKLLAEIAQSYEMSLIAPIFELAQTTPDFQILLYEFDGISVHFGRRKEEWRNKINTEVSVRAQRLGIITHLEWQVEPPPREFFH